MAQPLVTAVIVNWNGGKLLREALESLLAQTYPAVEVILVDNGSMDGSAADARAAYRDRLKVIENSTNQGFARGNNQGFREARGEWVFLLNNDAVADPRAVEELMAFAAGRPEAGMLACQVLQYDNPAIIDSAGLLVYPDGICRPRGWEEKDVGQYDSPEEVLAPHGCAAAYRKALLDETGGFDEDYFAYLEDLDLGMRGQLLGWPCWYVPTARVRHRKSATFGNYSKFKAYHVERNRVWNAVKLLPPRALLLSPWFTCLRYLLQGYAAATHRGISGSFVKEYSYPELAWLLARAYASALRALPRMLGRRRRIVRSLGISRREWAELLRRFRLDAVELAFKF